MNLGNDTTLKFGGTGGIYSDVGDDFLGQTVQIWADLVIDSIRIMDGEKEKKRYGGSGGRKVAQFTWPEDGNIELQNLYGNNCKGNDVVSYIKFRAGENIITCGNSNSPYRLDCDLQVKLTGISCDVYVDSLEFLVTAQKN